MNHVLVDVANEDDDLAAYNQPERALDIALIEAVATFILTQRRTLVVSARGNGADGAYSASPLRSRGTSPANPAACRMNRFFSGGARSTSPSPISRTVRSSVD